MKSNIHPDYNEITVTMTDGTSFKTKSTLAAGTVLRLDIDPKTHPAWTGQTQILRSGTQLDKFNKKFAGIGAKKGDDKKAS